MLLRYLKSVVLKKATKIKQTNGIYNNVYDDIKTYNVQMQDLTSDEISASIYGAKITKMIRLSSPRLELEKYLITKVENKQDNISNYYISYLNKLYKIVSVSESGIDIELVNSSSNEISL